MKKPDPISLLIILLLFLLGAIIFILYYLLAKPQLPLFNLGSFFTQTPPQAPDKPPAVYLALTTPVYLFQGQVTQIKSDLITVQKDLGGPNPVTIDVTITPQTSLTLPPTDDLAQTSAPPQTITLDQVRIGYYAFVTTTTDLRTYTGGEVTASAIFFRTGVPPTPSPSPEPLP